jgi:hypothetical protein
MSFNFKTKVVIKDINVHKMFHTYEHFIKDSKCQKFFQEPQNLECNYCKNFSNTLQFGIPVYIKEKEKSNLEIGISGNYCSFLCSYKHFVSFEEDKTYKKNIKFTDSGTFFKFLAYKFFKDYDIEKYSGNVPIDLNNYNISFKKV